MRLCLQRREFVAALGGAAIWARAAHAQQRALPVVGYVSIAGATPERERAFRQGLGEAGYIEGQNVVEYHILDGNLDRQDSQFHGRFLGVSQNLHSCPHGKGRPQEGRDLP